MRAELLQMAADLAQREEPFVLAVVGAGSRPARPRLGTCADHRRQVVKRHEAEVLPWPVAALADLGVPEDYARVKGGQGGVGSPG